MREFWLLSRLRRALMRGTGFRGVAINKFWRRIWRGDARRGALCAGVACSSVGSIGLGGSKEGRDTVGREDVMFI